MLTADDLDRLAAPEAAALLTECLPLARDPIKLVEKLKTVLPEHLARSAARLVELRLKARDRFKRADRMFFTQELLEQATSETVARYKGSLFNEGEHVGDLCCGMGGATIGLAAHTGRVTGCDINPLHVACAIRNLAVYALDSACTFLETDITVSIPECSAYHFDPSRRDLAGRIFGAENYLPPLSTVAAVRERSADVIVKASPLHNLDDLDDDCSADVVSLNGEVKEILLGYGRFDTGDIRAVMLPTATVVASGQDDLEEYTEAPEAFILDPDPAIVKAGLVPQAAALCGYRHLAGGTRYLTGPAPTTVPLGSIYRVIEVLPYNFKQLNMYLKARSIGHFIIKCKDTGLRPPAITAHIKSKGKNQAVIFYIERDEDKLFIVAENQG